MRLALEIILQRLTSGIKVRARHSFTEVMIRNKVMFRHTVYLMATVPVRPVFGERSCCLIGEFLTLLTCPTISYLTWRRHVLQGALFLVKLCFP